MHEVSLIYPAVLTVAGVFIANAAMILPLFLWVRAESRADIRHLDARLEANRELIREVHSESRNCVNAIHSEMKAIQLEMKDFHTKFLEIQKKNI